MKKAIFLILCIVLCMNSLQQVRGASSDLYSPSSASELSQMAMDIYHSDPLNPDALEEAMTLLEAALSLNANSQEAWENLLRVGGAAKVSPNDYSQEMRTALRKYVDARSNLAVAQEAVAYLIDSLNSRPEREELLSRLIYYFQEKNPPLVSRMLTYLSLLTVERGDFTTAQNLLLRAIQADPYNRQAFTNYMDLAARGTEGVNPAAVAIQYRRALTANPYDLSAAVIYADYLRRYGVYDLAAEAYEYCAELFKYLDSSAVLPEQIFRPWILVCLQSEAQVSECERIARLVRNSGRFDLTVEGAAGMAALKRGQTDQAQHIWQHAAARAEERLKSGAADTTVTPERLAWFYSFVWTQPEKALAWAHEAYTLRPENAETVALFAYALVLNEQDDVAEEYLAKLDTEHPVAQAARARMLRRGGKEGQATELLKQVAGQGPDTFIGLRAIELLGEMDSDYFPEVPAETVSSQLMSTFGDRVIPEVKDPGERLEMKINLSGRQILYGGEMNGRVVIENTGGQDLVIRDHSMFTGWIRVDAQVRGDLNVSIPKLIEMRLVPGQPIGPGQYASMEVNLLTGKLRELLLTFPQADVEVEFTMWLDPITMPDGSTQNRLKGLSPVRQVVSRNRTAVDSEFLIQRLDLLKSGSEGQKARAAMLFAGLLAEQAAAEARGVPYTYMKVEPKVLADALKKLLKDSDWKVQFQTLAALAEVRVPIDSNLVQTVSGLLNSEQWPVRLGAMIVLSRFESQNFQAVLKWQAQNDATQINQRMARALME